MSNTLLTTNDLAERLACSASTVRRLVRQGWLRPYYLTPHAPRFEWGQVLEQLEPYSDILRGGVASQNRDRGCI